MVDNSKNEEIKIKALLETYSISDISNTFKQIDKKLMALHQCSADDFLQLNNDFKNLYAQSKLISDNVDTVVQTIDSKESNEVYNEIHLFYKGIRNEANVIDEKINLIIHFLEDLIDKLRYTFFPIRNYNQNLISLKYLIANLNLALNITDNLTDISDPYNLIVENVNSTRLLIEKITKSLNNLRKISKSISEEFQLHKDQHEDNTNLLLVNLKDRVNGIQNKYIRNNECIPLIRKKTDKSSESISDIIKKLQYQDIIKQKMEHIQKTHKDLVGEIIDIEKSSKGEQHLNDKVKFFVRIRDIAGLQAAQLLHANKEYQSAIEIIVNNFLKVGDNMKAISEMCDTIHSEEENDEGKLFDEIIEQIKVTERNHEVGVDQNNKLKNDLLIVERKVEQSENYIKVLRNNSSELDKNLKNYLESIKEKTYKENKISDSVKQVKDLHDEIKLNAASLDNVLKDLNPIRQRIKTFMDEFTFLSIDTNFNEIREKVSRLYDVRKDIEIKLDKNHEISNSALKSIKKSISEIKYYDYFENIIEEIIQELNSINYNLKIDDSQSIDSVDENLAKIKEYYTMETEHIIHDQVSKGEDIDVDNEEDGEIEFF
mgnify:CR=1 FL=1